jgi:DNA polymerase-3 subunit epsilon
MSDPSWLQPWAHGPFAALDFETTHSDPFEARVVSASLLMLGRGRDDTTRWLINPGIEIPLEAVGVHGITTEFIRQRGRPAVEAVAELADAIRQVWAASIPLVTFNAPYEITVITSELMRYDLGSLRIGTILDPLVIDRKFWKFRPGKDRLEDCCAAYKVKPGNAHDDAWDARAAARLIWVQARKFQEFGSLSLEQLQGLQAAWYQHWAEDFEHFLRVKAREPKPDAVIEREWPLRTTRLLV